MNRLIPRKDFFKSPYGQATLIFLVAVLPYLLTLHFPFMLDDTPSIVENPVIQDLGRFLSGDGFRYNPRRFIGYLTLALNYHFGALDVVGYHLVNIAIHALTALLVYALVRFTFATPWLRDTSLAARGEFIALATALLFAAHPIQSQAVTYLVQRFASLAAFFYLLSLVLYIWGRLRVGNQKLFIPLVLFAGAACAGLLAMLTKETAVTLPFMILLFEVSFFRSSRRRNLVLIGGFVGAVALFLALLAFNNQPIDELFNQFDRLSRETQFISRWDYLLTQFRVIVTYLRLLFLPIEQNLDYDFTLYHTFFTAPVLLSFLFLSALFLLALYLYGFRFKRLNSSFVTRHSSRISNPESRLIGFGILWYFIALAVESSLIPIADVLVEHRLYLPSVGIALALTVTTVCLGRRLSSRQLLALLAVVVMVLGMATVRRNLVWSDPVTLWSDVAAKSPGNARAWCNLGVALLERGEVDAGIDKLVKSSLIDPTYAKTQLNLGVALGQKNRFREAAHALEAALRLNPKLWLAHANLGTIYQRMGRREEAIEHLESAVQLNPRDTIARAQLDRLLRLKGIIPPQGSSPAGR